MMWQTLSVVRMYTILNATCFKNYFSRTNTIHIRCTTHSIPTVKNNIKYAVYKYIPYVCIYIFIFDWHTIFSEFHPCASVVEKRLHEHCARVGISDQRKWVFNKQNHSEVKIRGQMRWNYIHYTQHILVVWSIFVIKKCSK